MFYDLHAINDKSFQFFDVNSSDLSEVRCLKENEKRKRVERAMMRAMCGQKIIDKRLNPLPTY